MSETRRMGGGRGEMYQLTRHFSVKIFDDTSSGGIVPRDIWDAADSATEKGDRGNDRGWERGEIGDAGRENRVIYCKQYYRRHAEGAEEWEKPVSLVPEMYFIATEDGVLAQTATPLTYSPSGRPLDLNKSMAERSDLYSPFIVSRSRCSLPDLCGACEWKSVLHARIAILLFTFGKLANIRAYHNA